MSGQALPLPPGTVVGLLAGGLSACPARPCRRPQAP